MKTLMESDGEDGVPLLQLDGPFTPSLLAYYLKATAIVYNYRFELYCI